MSNPKRRFPFVQVDVFTSVPLEGNQLAVFPDARGLSDAEMQAVAREMNLSETTFILPDEAARERERGVRVRIFTVNEELPFAGHPTLGTAMVIRGSGNAPPQPAKTARVGRPGAPPRHANIGRAGDPGAPPRHANIGCAGDPGADEVALNLNVGKIPVRFSSRQGLPFGVMTQRNPEFGQVHAREAVARAAGLQLADIADDIPVQTVSTGNAFAMVPVASLSVLQNLAPTWATMEAYLKQSDAKFFYFVSRQALNPEARLQARMIFYNGEDPATGSAAGPCAAWAVRYGVIPSEQEALLEQGVEMKRRSRIFLSAARAGDKIVNVRVGGHAVEVARGEIFL